MFELLAREKKIQDEQRGESNGIHRETYVPDEICYYDDGIEPHQHPAFTILETVRLFSRQARGARAHKPDPRDDN